jgi:cytochrome c oxidase cbb3-type subunit 1
MTAQTTEPTPVSPVNSGNAQPLPHEVDSSCRTPVLYLITCSMLWLLFSLLMGVLAMVKMHAPGLLADVSPLTYGRVAAVASSAFFYGFASQAGIAIALWLFARLGKTFLVLPRAGLVAAIFWNLVLTLGIIGIFAGDMNHFPVFEMPGWTAGGFLIAFLVLGLSGLLTYVARSERDSYPSNWFLFAAFFALPWILSAGWLLLGHYQVRGVLQPIFSTWYANNFVLMWLAPIAIAIVFYFVSKLSQQPLYSYSLAAFGFWFYIAFAHASGFQNLVAVPNWMPSLSTVINLLLLLPVTAILIDWYRTWKAPDNRPNKVTDSSARYITFSMYAFAVAAFLLVLISCPKVNGLIGLTIFIPGVAEILTYGFIGMAFFAAIIHILPRLTEVDWPNPKLLSGHYTLTAAGIGLSVAAFLIGGYLHGRALNNPAIPAVQVSKQIVPFIGIGTLGLLLVLVGQLALFWNMALMFKSCCAACCGLSSGKEVAR